MTSEDTEMVHVNKVLFRSNLTATNYRANKSVCKTRGSGGSALVFFFFMDFQVHKSFFVKRPCLSAVHLVVCFMVISYFNGLSFCCTPTLGMSLVVMG